MPLPNIARGALPQASERVYPATTQQLTAVKPVGCMVLESNLQSGEAHSILSIERGNTAKNLGQTTPPHWRY